MSVFNLCSVEMDVESYNKYGGCAEGSVFKKW